MSILRVTAFRKVISIEDGHFIGSVQVFLGDAPGPLSFPRLPMPDFLGLVHILEEDEVYYDNEKYSFFTRPEPAI